MVDPATIERPVSIIHFGLKILDSGAVKLIIKAATPIGNLEEYQNDDLYLQSGRLHMDSSRDDCPVKNVLPPSGENDEDCTPPKAWQQR